MTACCFEIESGKQSLCYQLIGATELGLLTAKGFAILELLMKYPDKIFSKANLFQSVWNTEYISEDNTLNVHISNLRNKMKAICPDKEFIDTVWGIGYRLHKAEG